MKFGFPKNFDSNKNRGKKKLGHQKFWARKKLSLTKKFWFRKNLSQQKNFVQKNFVQKKFCQKNFG